MSSPFNNERSEHRTVNLSYDNLAEVKRQVDLAKKRLFEGKTFLADQHLTRVLYHLELHRVQQEQLAKLRKSESLGTESAGA
jgi:hypothetical protein